MTYYTRWRGVIPMFVQDGTTVIVQGRTTHLWSVLTMQWLRPPGRINPDVFRLQGYELREIHRRYAAHLVGRWNLLAEILHDYGVPWLARWLERRRETQVRIATEALTIPYRPPTIEGMINGRSQAFADSRDGASAEVVGTPNQGGEAHGG